MLTLDELQAELMAQGLLQGVAREEFLALSADAIGWDCSAGHGEFEAMAILEAYYGITADAIDSTRLDRCAHDRIVVFNELHEVPSELVEAAFGALAGSLGIALSLAEARDADTDDCFDEERLTSLLEHALRGRSERAMVFGEDTWVGWIVRDTFAPSKLSLFAEPAPTR